MMQHGKHIVNVYLREQARCFVLVVLILSAAVLDLNAQSLTLFDIDASAYPVMRAKFYAFDANGNQLTSLAPGDLQLREDSIERTVTRVSCPSASPSTALSSVLTIDISESMSGARIATAKTAARAWIGALTLGRSECAVTSFNHSAYIDQDYTTERAALLRAVEALHPVGGTNFDVALLTSPAGALEVSKRGRNRKVIVLLSDGEGSMLHQSEIIAEALRQSVTVYAVMLGISAPQSVRNMCVATGGMYYEHITTEAEPAETFRRILRTAQGGSPCELEWTSAGCAITRTLEAKLSRTAVTTTALYVVPSALLPQVVYTPSRSLRFGGVAPGTQSQQQVTLTAQGGIVHIDALTLTHPRFSIVDYGGAAPPFTLGAGQSRTLRVQYAPADSTYTYCRIELQSGACFGTSFYADGGWRGKQVIVKVVHPNGGERLAAGSEEELRWEGVMPEDTVRLEYSIDGGASWQHISDEATGLRHTWRVPQQPSDSCLLRVTDAWKPTFIGDMALIPSGTFRMGNITDHPDGNDDEKPVHEVSITQPFLMSRTEVTQSQYEAVMGRNPSHFKGAARPVELVSWYEAVEFCNELSRREGLDTCYSGSGAGIVCDFTANGYRLPTEAEWEYACRAGTETDFYTGNMTHSGSTPLDPALDRAGWYYGNSEHHTHGVGEKEPNAYGLYDMHGNVYEWCWDRYDHGYYASSPTEDPRGPASGDSRVLRGGSWDLVAWYSRSADRHHDYDPGNRRDYTGFRLVRTY